MDFAKFIRGRCSLSVGDASLPPNFAIPTNIYLIRRKRAECVPPVIHIYILPIHIQRRIVRVTGDIECATKPSNIFHIAAVHNV